MRIHILAALMASTILPSVVHAQASDDVVVMRRQVSKPVIHTDKSTAPSDQAGTWVPGEWRWTGTETCQQDAPRERDVKCMAFGKEVSASRCRGEKDDATGSADRFEGCTYKWIPDQFTDYSPRCSATGTQTRAVRCQRNETLQQVDDAFCPAATRPDTSKTDLVTASCRWKPTEWQTPSGCGRVTQTRTAACQDDDTKTPADVALCQAAVAVIGAKPEESQPTSNYDSCTFEWRVTGYEGWKTACSATARRNKIYTCMRSDNTVAADQASCTAPRPTDEDVGVSPCTDAIKNPGFESGPSIWTGDYAVYKSDAQYPSSRPSYYGITGYSGNAVAIIYDVSRQGRTGPRQVVPVVAGTKYQVTAHATVPSTNNAICANDTVYLRVINGADTLTTSSGKYSADLKTVTSATFIAKGSSVTVGLDMYSSCNTGSVGAADDVSLTIVP